MGVQSWAVVGWETHGVPELGWRGGQVHMLVQSLAGVGLGGTQESRAGLAWG